MRQDERPRKNVSYHGTWDYLEMLIPTWFFPLLEVKSKEDLELSFLLVLNYVLKTMTFRIINETSFRLFIVEANRC